MANKSSITNNDILFSSLISDIKNYSGSDPLIPWLRGIRKMTDELPLELLKQKLPRFLQKCAQTFQSDNRYRNDSRYVRVWIKLLDFVDDPGAVLENMKANHIGNKRSLFYQAYALYYEKMKNFTDAEKMYHLGVRNFAEPSDELQKSFDQFLRRLAGYKSKRIQRDERQSARSLVVGAADYVKPKSRQVEDKKVISQSSGRELDKHVGENTVVVRFAKTAIDGKSEAEDARHHGLVEPTINTKEAMDAINSMFCEPLASEPFPKYNSSKSKENFEVFNDNDSGSKVEMSNQSQPMKEHFEIYCDDDEENNEDEKDKFDHKMAIPADISKDSESDRVPPVKFKEDTVVFRFVGSTILDEPKVENVCHHGLVEPTINLKEAMDDINSMFGKPIEFVKKRRPSKQEKPFEERRNCSSFLILPDDEKDHHHHHHQQRKSYQPCSSSSTKENDLFEQTVCTKEAMDDINKMFAMPLDF
ncbi:uncharacterized protein [Rutidosis leptorrhynchoides]|uniref:uncharacterized protein n=1 Tax=Rutidosis leptorrhynchoides TaxID=125765 RepID=UPI003A993590